MIEIDGEWWRAGRNGIDFPAATYGERAPQCYRSSDSQACGARSCFQSGTPPWLNSIALSMESTSSRFFTRAPATFTSAAP